jgi:peptidoglycan/LPS O-acetylase OafA/YrhL
MPAPREASNGHPPKAGLRALAILAVFYTHATEILGPNSSHGVFITRFAYDFNLGRVGVVTFFAISGFLIPSSLHGARGDGSVRFVFSRIFRLYPAFWLSVLPSVAAVYLYAGTWFARDDILLNFTMLPRFFGASYANGGYWTLEVETIFYATTLFLFIGGVVGSQFILSCLMFGGFLLFYTSQRPIMGGALNPALSPDAFYLSLHLACMFWGAMCRQWWDGNRLEPIPKLLFWAFTGYWLLYTPLDTAWQWIGQPDLNIRLQAGYSLGLGIFFVIMLTEASLGRVISWIGRISYSLYLLQFTGLILVNAAILKWPVLQGQWLEINILYALLLSLALSDLSYRLIEKPSISLGRWFADHAIRGGRTMLPFISRLPIISRWQVTPGQVTPGKAIMEAHR